MAQGIKSSAPQIISITPLLRRLWPSPGENNVTAEEIALAISHIFTDQLSPVQTGALLTCLHFTGWDRRADVIAKCAEVMRNAASQIDRKELERAVKAHGRSEGDYRGGLVSFWFCFRNKIFADFCSVILWAQEVTHITLSIFQQLPPFWPHLFSC